MKRLSLVLLAAIMVFILISCGSNGSSPTPTPQPSPTPTPESTVATATPTPESTAVPTAKPTNKASSSTKTSFTNKYGTPTTICAHRGCTNYIASSGDTNCCTTHSRRCAECGKYIDEDGTWCMDCLKKGAEQVVQSKQKKCSDCSNPATKILVITDPSGKSESFSVCQKHYDMYKKEFNSRPGWSAW